MGGSPFDPAARRRAPAALLQATVTADRFAGTNAVARALGACLLGKGIQGIGLVVDGDSWDGGIDGVGHDGINIRIKGLLRKTPLPCEKRGLKCTTPSVS